MEASVHTIAPRHRIRPEAWLRSGGLLGIWLLLLIFIVYPLLMLFSRAFLDDGHLSLQALWAAITAPKNLRALGNSLLLAMLVGVAGTLLGLIFAFTVERVGARAPCVAPDRLLHLPAADLAALHHLHRLRVFVRTARPDHLRTARASRTSRSMASPARLPRKR